MLQDRQQMLQRKYLLITLSALKVTHSVTHFKYMLLCLLEITVSHSVPTANYWNQSAPTNYVIYETLNLQQDTE